MTSDRFARVVGQDEAVRRLEAALSRGAAGRAFLFVGPRGVGRDLAARVFAAALMCPNGACGDCGVCARVLDGPEPRHIDVTVVAPEGAFILVEQIRELRAVAARTPHEAPVKILLIQQAETMNPAPSNALLKVLEEPSHDTVFILITDRPEDLLDTIRSRCERIDFKPLPPSVIRSILIEREGADEVTADWATRAGGDLATALRLVKDPDARERRERHIELASRVVRGGVPAIVDLATEVLEEAAVRVAQRRTQHTEEREELESLLGDGRGSAGALTRLKLRHKREEKAEELVAVDAALRDLASFYRDCLAVGVSASPSSIVNVEHVDRVQRGAGAVDPAWLATAVQAIEERRRMLDRNVAPRLALESLFAILSTPRPNRP